MVKTILITAFLACILVQSVTSDPLKPRQEEEEKPIEFEHTVNENYTIKWKIDKTAKTIQFTTSAKTQGWVGLGFNKDKAEMDGAELVLAGYKPKPTEATTAKPTTVEQPETTTVGGGESTTVVVPESTTVGGGESTTVGGGSSTVGGGSSTVGDGSSTVGDGSSTVGDGSSTVGDGSSTVGDGSSTVGDGSTSEAPVDSTTEGAGESTTEAAGESTTEAAGESTTEAAGESTTEAAGESTTEAAGESTTEAAGESTTEAAGESTTEAAGESTTEGEDGGEEGGARVKRSTAEDDTTYIHVFKASAEHNLGEELVNSAWSAKASDLADGFTGLVLTRPLDITAESGEVINFTEEDTVLNVLVSFGETDDTSKPHVWRDTFKINLYTNKDSGAASITKLSIMSSIVAAMFALNLF